MTTASWTARQQVAPDPAPALLDDELDAYHRALLVDPANTPDHVAALFHAIVPILVMWRGKVGAVAPRRIAVEPVLDDPAHDDYPARAAWSHQYAAMCREEMDALHHVCNEVWALNRFWRHLVPRDRKTHGLGDLVGIQYAREDLGCDLPFLTTGPLQDAAPLPPGYAPPDGFTDELVPNFKLMLNICPF